VRWETKPTMLVLFNRRVLAVGGHISGKMKLYTFLLKLMHILFVLILPGSTETDVG